MTNFIFLIILLINLHLLSAAKENINQIKYLDFYKDKITEDDNKQLQCLNKVDENLCKKYSLKINHVRCENLNFNKTITNAKWNCEIVLKRKSVQLKEFKINCKNYEYDGLDNILISIFDNDNLRVETCFLEYNLEDIDLTRLNISTRPIDLKIILEASTGSFVSVFLIFLLGIQFKNSNHLSNQNNLSTQNSTIVDPMDSNRSQILLQNIDKNIDKVKIKISSGFAAGYLIDREPLTQSSSIASTSFS